MDINRSPHLSEEQLARLLDGELPAREAQHVESCAQCSARLNDIRAAAAAYTEYRDQIRGPQLPAAPGPWRSLDTLVAQHEAARPHRLLRWWPLPALAAAACLLAAVVVYRNADGPSVHVTELLTRSANASPSRIATISFRTRGRTLVRPAVMTSEDFPEADPSLAHLQQLFATAHYSWQEPMSPRALLRWRGTLARKHDSVTEVHEQGQPRAYRVRTETPTGTLRSASLTLNAEDLRPTNASFDFANEGPVDVAEAGAPIPATPQTMAAIEPPLETPLNPADTLHVLAALNAIEADAGEPIAVTEDPEHRRVVVSATGLPIARQQQLREALRHSPRVTLDFDSPGVAPMPALEPSQERSSNAIPPALRRQFEDRLGGAVALQEATDKALEAGASAIAHAHAVEVLAGKFPPDIEARFNASDRAILRNLQQHHVSELARQAATIRAELKPLLATVHAPVPPTADNGSGVPWQAGVANLVTSAREIDNLLNRLLAGSYSQPSGEEMLHSLALRLDQFEGSIHSQRAGGQ